MLLGESKRTLSLQVASASRYQESPRKGSLLNRMMLRLNSSPFRLPYSIKKKNAPNFAWDQIFLHAVITASFWEEMSMLDKMLNNFFFSQ